MNTATDTSWFKAASTRLPGLALVGAITLIAYWLAQFFSLPAIIIALLAGMACNPLIGRLPSTQTGICFAADPLMKIGVACLGAGVNVYLILEMGWPILMALITAMGLTVLVGLILGRWLGQTSRFSLLTAGAVAICGSSAALAICCTLPKGTNDERDLSVVIIGISILSAAGILLYPLLTNLLGLNDMAAGFVLGGSLHNVAQAIAAGFSVSDVAGETATLVKMSRVALLAPFIMLIALTTGREEADQPRKKWLTLPPLFLIGFIILMIFAAAGLIPPTIKVVLAWLAKAGLLLAMTAIGLKTSLLALMKVDGRSIGLLIAETLVMLIVILCAVHLIAF